jgi:hypothetical protein
MMSPKPYTTHQRCPLQPVQSTAAQTLPETKQAEGYSQLQWTRSECRSWCRIVCSNCLYPEIEDWGVVWDIVGRLVQKYS